MAKEPSDRYSSIQEFLSAWKQALASTRAPKPTITSRIETAQPHERAAEQTTLPIPGSPAMPPESQPVHEKTPSQVPIFADITSDEPPPLPGSKPKPVVFPWKTALIVSGAGVLLVILVAIVAINTLLPQWKSLPVGTTSTSENNQTTIAAIEVKQTEQQVATISTAPPIPTKLLIHTPLSISPSPMSTLPPIPSSTVDTHNASRWEQINIIPVAGLYSFTSDLAFSPDGKTLIVATGGDRRVHIYEIPSGKEKSGFIGDHDVRSLSFSPDGKYLITGGDDWLNGWITPVSVIWNTASGELLQTMWGQQVKKPSWDEVGKLVVSPDSHTVATISSSATSSNVILWEIPSGKRDAAISTYSEVLSALFSPDSNLLAVETENGKLYFFEPKKGSQKASWQREKWSMAAFSTDGNNLIAIDTSCRILFLDINTGNKLKEVKSEKKDKPKCGSYLTISSNKKVIVTGDYQGAITLWDVETGEPLQTLENNTRAYQAAFSEDGTILATLSDLKVIIWGLQRE
jgi:WD40 repeat protein